MARRDVPFGQGVTQVVAEAPVTQTIASQLAGVAAKMTLDHEQSVAFQKTTELQVAINKMNQDFRGKYAKDPVSAQPSYYKDREKLFNDFIKEIPYSQRNNFFNAKEKLFIADQASIEDFAFKQQQVNIQDNLNTMIESQIQFAEELGASGSDIDIAANFAIAMDELDKATSGLIDTNASNKAKRDFGTDYAKALLSGVAQTDPQKAADMLNDDFVKKILPEKDLSDMRSALVAKATRAKQDSIDLEVLSNVGAITDIFAGGSGASYLQVRKQLDSIQNLSDEARDYVLQKNGFKGPAAEKAEITASEKLKARVQLADTVGAFLSVPRTKEEAEGFKKTLIALADDKRFPMSSLTKAINQVDKFAEAGFAPSNTDELKNQRAILTQSLDESISRFVLKKPSVADIEAMQQTLVQHLVSGDISESQYKSFSKDILPAKEQATLDYLVELQDETNEYGSAFDLTDLDNLSRMKRGGEPSWLGGVAEPDESLKKIKEGDPALAKLNYDVYAPYLDKMKQFAELKGVALQDIRKLPKKEVEKMHNDAKAFAAESFVQHLGYKPKQGFNENKAIIKGESALLEKRAIVEDILNTLSQEGE